jgi:hypothetical protein
MAAFRRRTVFAAPLIVIAGCGGKDGSQDPSRLPGQSWTVRKQGATCRADHRIDCPPNVACNPPAPLEIECPPGATEAMTVTVVAKADKTCAIVPRACTSLDCATEATPCPTPPKAKVPSPKLIAIWSIHPGRSSPGSCEAFDDLACNVPPGQPAPPCNPPPPEPVACPTGYVIDRPMRIGQLADGTCVVAPAPCKDSSCVKEAIECPVPRKPGAQTLTPTWSIARHEKDGKASCNVWPAPQHFCPTPPYSIDCPATHTDQQQILVARLADGSCTVLPAGCTDTSCAQGTIACPPR